MAIKQDCYCWMCRKDTPVVTVLDGPLAGRKITEGMNRMFLCPTCGNKRCPHATDHREPCSGSNEPGQLGSHYGVWPNPNRKLFEFTKGNDPTI